MYNHLMIILGVVFGCVGISVTVAIFYWYIRRASGTRTSEKSLGRKTFGYHQLGHRQIEHHASPSIPATAYLSPPNLLPTHVSYSSPIHNWYGNKELQKTDSNVTSFPKLPFLNFGKLPTANPHEIWAPTDLEKGLSRFGVGSSVDSTRSHGINQPLRTLFQPSIHYPSLDEIDHFGSVSDTKEAQDFSSRSCLPSCNNNDDLQVNSSLFTRINSSAGELSWRNQAFRISPNLIKDSSATGSTTRPPAVHLLPGAGSPDHTRPSQTSTSCTQLAPQATPLVLPSSWTTHIKCEFPSCERTFKHKHEYNRHKKSHIHPKPCPYCDRGFETTKDVNRHINGVHETTKRWFCTVARCRYSRSSVGPHRTFPHGKGFSRKDNWSRHMKNKHGVSER